MNSELSFSSRYQILSTIGSGGMGEVFKAWDVCLNCEVALKIIRAETGNNPRIRKCFAREARAFNLLHHPNIVELYDYGVTDSGQIYISTELIHGLSLHGIQDARLSIADIRNLITQILDALSAAHARGLVHCDLKAENVLVTLREGELFIKLADFGLASLPNELPDLHDVTFGTPAYMAPEQILKQHRLIGACTDIYSAGILLFELITKKLPFDKAVPIETMQAQIREAVPDIVWPSHLSLLPSQTKKAFSEIIATALQKQPWRRFISASEFRETLSALKLPKMISRKDAVFDKLRELAAEQTSAVPNRTTGDLGNKIRAVEAVEDSGIHWPPERGSHEVSADEMQAPRLSESLEQSALFGEEGQSAGYTESEAYLTELVHQTEFSILQKDVERAQLGFGRLRVISGGFGSGKTKLLKVFSSRCLAGKFYTITCSASLYNASSLKKQSSEETTNLVFQKLVQQMINACPENAGRREPGWSVSESGLELLKGLRQYLQEDTPIDEHFCASIVEYFIRALTELSSQMSLAIIVDDIQRCTEQFFHVLERLKNVVERLPVLIFVTHDSHELSNCVENKIGFDSERFKSVFSSEIHLEPLDTPTMAQMIKVCAHVDDRLSHRVALASFGNPYYAIALIQHLNQNSRLIKNKQGFLSLSPDDNQPLGVPLVVRQFLQKKLSEIALEQGAQSDFYREILIRLSAFGYEMTLSEADVFWNNDEDRALSAYWHEALESWVRMNMLTLSAIDVNGRTETKIAFTEPWHSDVLQSELSARRIRELKAQVAVTLMECYEEPTPEQFWRIAQLWKGAADGISYIQCCQQSAVAAYDKADLRFAFERCENIGAAFDVMMGSFDTSRDIQKAISWPDSIILGAEISLMLGKNKEFEQYCSRLKIWEGRYNQPVCLAHIQRLNAKKLLRNGQLSRAAEIAQLSRESFEICNAQTDAVLSTVVLSDVYVQQNELRNAKQLLHTALNYFTKNNDLNGMASSEVRLALLEWFFGDTNLANVLVMDAHQHFNAAHDGAGVILSKAMLDLIHDIIEPASEHYQKIIDDYRNIVQMGDEPIIHLAQTFMLLFAMFHDDQKTIESLSEKVTSKAPSAAFLSGTQGCIRAVNMLKSGELEDAENEITMAIASFGPQNRRARAWCHTLIGICSIFARELRQGVQAFERARNDFQALGDRFGITSVSVAQSALAEVCGQSDDAFAMAIEAYEASVKNQYSHLSLLAYVVAAESALHSGNMDKISIPACEYPVFPFIRQGLNEILECFLMEIRNEPSAENIYAYIDRCLNREPDDREIIQSIGYPSVEITF